MSEEFFGEKVEVLVNNAGINHAQGWEKCLSVNLVRKALILTCSPTTIWEQLNKDTVMFNLLIRKRSIRGS